MNTSTYCLATSRFRKGQKEHLERGGEEKDQDDATRRRVDEYEKCTRTKSVLTDIVHDAAQCQEDCRNGQVVIAPSTIAKERFKDVSPVQRIFECRSHSGQIDINKKASLRCNQQFQRRKL